MSTDNFFKILDEINKEAETIFNGDLPENDKASKASELLKSKSASEAFNLDEFLNYIQSNQFNLPTQFYSPGSFSDFCLTIKEGINHRIDLYFWATIDTGIHSHPFYGAFELLHGVSQQNIFSFKPCENNHNLTIGELTLESSVNLNPGDIQTIHYDEDFIHHSLHLEKTSVTLCLRNTHADQSINYNYRYPDLRIKRFFYQESELKKYELLNYLIKIQADTKKAVNELSKEGLLFYYFANPKSLSELLTNETSDLIRSYTEEFLNDENLSDLKNTIISHQKFMQKIHFTNS